MGNDFGVSFSRELVAFFGQLLFQAEVVLNDAVVDDDDFSGAVAMRMCVFFRRTAVSRPAGMADPIGPFERLIADSLLKVAQFTLGAANVESTLTVVADCDASRGISAIFEPT